MHSFSENLARLMRDGNMNQPKLSKLSGVDQSLISRYLREDPRAKLPKVDNLMALAGALGCSLDHLVGWSQQEYQLPKQVEIAPTQEQLTLWRKYAELPRGHWLKATIDQELLGKTIDP